MTASDLGVGLRDPAGVTSAPPASDVRRLPELVGSAEERRWAESWNAWADLRAPALAEAQEIPAWAPARGARWAGHRRPRGLRQPPSAAAG